MPPESITNYARAKQLQAYLRTTDFYTAPASSRFHGAYPAGLLEHSTNVFINLLRLTSCMELKWQREESPYIIAIGHDVCKTGLYIKQPDGTYTRNLENPICLDPEYHGALSVKRLKDAGIELTDEEKLCIRYHMGAFVPSDEWGEYTDAIHKYPNVLWTHTADMMAAHIDEVKYGD